MLWVDRSGTVRGTVSAGPRSPSSAADPTRPQPLEIKTTCGNERTPFWMTKRECDVAAEQGDIYRIRRVFHFRNEVKMFDIAPPLEAALLLTPATFMAAPR
jgi:hypothetical protein